MTLQGGRPPLYPPDRLGGVCGLGWDTDLYSVGLVIRTVNGAQVFSYTREDSWGLTSTYLEVLGFRYGWQT
jgi:hypothetical protein